MSLKEGRKFSTGASAHRQRQMSTLVEKEGIFGPSLTVGLSPFCCPLLPSTIRWCGRLGPVGQVACNWPLQTAIGVLSAMQQLAPLQPRQPRRIVPHTPSEHARYFDRISQQHTRYPDIELRLSEGA